MSAVTFDSKIYRKLLFKKPPRVIHTAKENEEYIRDLEAVYSRQKLTLEEKEYAELLTVLIEKFEERYQVTPAATPLDVLHSLMDAADLKQTDMLEIFGTKSVTSEVLSGKRDLSKTHIQRLALRFHVSPEVFFPPTPERESPR